tara:strand:+ start:9893 stop:10273 length:381 start_codon:yes stop_codon:yes gene_type:complete
MIDKKKKLIRYNNKNLHKSLPQPQQNVRQSSHNAPLPQQNLPQLSHNEGFISSIFGSVIQGAALGTGSQLANRTLDSLMGPKKIEISDNSDKCINETDLYLKCMNNNNDSTICKEYFEMLTKCKNM